MKSNKGWLVCLSVLAGLTLANAASANDNADNNQQQTVTTSQQVTVDSNDTNSNVTNGTVATAKIVQNVDQPVEATTTQARASIPTYLNNDGQASGLASNPDSFDMYLYDESGHLVTQPGWHHYDHAFHWVNNDERYSAWFYVLPDHTCAIKWQYIDGYWYYFAYGKGGVGEMYSDATLRLPTSNNINDYDDFAEYTFDSQGHLVGSSNDNTNNANTGSTGWQQVDGSWQYLQNGQALTSWQSINGHWYYFDDNGDAQTSLQQINGRWYDFDETNAWAKTGWQKIDGNWYHFDETNAWANTGWYKSGAGNWYYFNQDGTALTGQQTINGYSYYFDDNNAWAKTGWQQLDGDWYYFDPAN